MSLWRRSMARLRSGTGYSLVLLAAVLSPERRRLLSEVLALGSRLAQELDRPLLLALDDLTPVPESQVLDPEAIRQVVDAATAFGVGRPLGICLRRSLLRYHFLRRAGVPVVVHFGARRLGDGMGGHAWLTLRGEPYHELREHYENYALMLSFPEITPAAHD